ncbi:hypothetical protein BS329_40175 [Amycolatopsis coloradensis]|uniref:YD repeat-containing protein n=1 Tax=Amycolatopsis coloradensis TaxID=76021 RepID=A0A1R0KDU9_9PSEU|nr:hypothetical protein [Amycolatopsis coloradensis]OLZ43158.1 hypothetical protein BS329_40175 [Amycolatopsis coloradensis]
MNAYGDTTTTVTDPNRHQSTYTIDDKQRQTKATDALGHTRAQSWSANGDVASVTDGMNNSVTYDYDTLNNLKGGKLPTSATASVGYTDTAHPHLPTQVSDFSGTKVTKSYDSNGNVKTVRADGLGADVTPATAPRRPCPAAARRPSRSTPAGGRKPSPSRTLVVAWCSPAATATPVLTAPTPARSRPVPTPQALP